MKKSNVLKVVMSSALVASVAATAAISASAISNVSEIKDHSVGVVGSFNGWDNDIVLTDEDGDGVFEGVVEVAEVTDDMITDWTVDDELTGEKYLMFKVRLDGSWDDSWGNYEPLNDRTWNSQSNVPVKEAKVGEAIKFNVIFDTTKIDAGYLSNPDSAVAADDDIDIYNIGVTYEIIADETPAVESSVEESSEESVSESSVETSTETSTTTTTSETPATETSTDTTTVPTGDTTSAVALAAVVIASLGTAVVMTKKASSKD